MDGSCLLEREASSSQQGYCISCRKQTLIFRAQQNLSYSQESPVNTHIHTHSHQALPRNLTLITGHPLGYLSPAARARGTGNFRNYQWFLKARALLLELAPLLASFTSGLSQVRSSGLILPGDGGCTLAQSSQGLQVYIRYAILLSNLQGGDLADL